MPYSNIKKTGSVAARTRQAVHEASTDWIGYDYEYDRHGAGGLQRRSHGRTALGQNDVWRECDQFFRIFTDAPGLTGAPAILNPYVATVSPAQFLQSPQERSDAG